MASYKILIADSVDNYLERTDKSDREHIIKRLRLLEESPHTVGEPRGKFWILKVGRAGYRLAYSISEQEKVVKVTAIEQRKSEKYKEFYE